LDRKGKGPSADVNMVFMLPMEFLVPFSDDEEISLPDQIAQLALDPMTAIFEKPSNDERHHLKALFVKGRVDGQLISKILIDGGAAINTMPYVMYRNLKNAGATYQRAMNFIFHEFIGKLVEIYIYDVVFKSEDFIKYLADLRKGSMVRR